MALLSAVVAAQELPGTVNTAKPPAPAKPAAAQAPQIPTIVSNVDLVNMVFSVETKHGGFVPNLTQNDFRVLEDGKPQTVQFFSAEDQLPITVGLLLDTSPSQMNVLPQEQRLSDQFFRQVVTPKDLAFVLNFDITATLAQDLTSSQSLLDAAVEGVHIGGGELSGGVLTPGPLPSSSQGATHLWDAIYLACHDELAHQVGRKAIVVVTDGGEEGSSYTDQDALRAALDSNTVVYAILAYDRSYGGFGGYARGAGPGQLAKIAEQTGGRSIDAGNNMTKAFDQIQQELRSQYSLEYRSTNPARDGAFRMVKIETTAPEAKDNKVRARSGYFAPRN